MEVNKDEALRCLGIARKHLDARNLPSARKFCEKSIRLYETDAALRVLKLIEKAELDGGSEEPSDKPAGGSRTTTTEEHPSAAGMKHRHPSSASASASASSNGTAGGMGGEAREYTPEQVAVVKRVRKCKVTAYYEILSVKKECDDAEIKKAYRKVCPNWLMLAARWLTIS